MKTAINDTSELLETIQPVEYNVRGVEEWYENVKQKNHNYVTNKNVDSEGEKKSECHLYVT